MRLRALLLALCLLASLASASTAAAHGGAQDAALARGISQGPRGARPERIRHRRRDRRSRDRPDHLPPQRLAPAAAGLDGEALHDRRRPQHAAPGFRFATTVAGAGTQAGAVWNGDLYLVGSGDPTFSTYDLESLAAQVKAHGITHISGRIRGDERVFDTSRWGPWPLKYMGVESPPLSGLALDRDVTAEGRDVASPPRSAARAFRKALAAVGVTVGVRFVGGGPAPKTAVVLGRVQSEPLWRIVRFMDRHSDNFTAEMVAKAVGHYAGGDGTTARGMHVAGEIAKPMLGEDAALVHLADGSGLSHANRTTASALARLLAGAAADPAIAKPLAGALSMVGHERHARPPPARAARPRARQERHARQRLRARGLRHGGERAALRVRRADQRARR